MSKRLGRRVKTDRTSTRSNHSLDYLLDRFYTVKKAEGRAKGTLASIKQTNYKFFLEYLEIRKLPNDIRLITVDLIRDYIVWMLHEKVCFDGHKFKSEEEKTVGLSPVTVNTRLKMLRTFFQFLKLDGYMEENPMEAIDDVEERKENIRVLCLVQERRRQVVNSSASFNNFQFHNWLRS